MMQEKTNMSLVDQAGQFANSKLADSENMQGMMQGEQQPPQPE